MKLIESFKKLDFDQKITVVLVTIAACFCLLMALAVCANVTADIVKQINQGDVK